MSPAGLSARIERERRKLLGQLGITDVDAFKREAAAKAERLAQLEAEAEERKRAELSELERVQLDAQKAQEEAATWRSQYEDLQEKTVALEQDRMIDGIANGLVDPTMLEFAKHEFRKFVKRMEQESPRSLARLTERDVERFFRDLVKRNPKFAPDDRGRSRTAPPRRTQPAPAPARRPGATTTSPPRRPLAAQNGKPAARPAPAPPVRQRAPHLDANGKTPLPGRPNSMSKEELRAFAKSKGFTLP